MGDRQLDMPWSLDFYTLPKHLPGRMNTDDFVFFDFSCSGIDCCDYTVVVESLDVSGPTYRSIGKLQKAIELPHVKFGWSPKIGVIPNSEHLPAFEAEMVRGNTYAIPNTYGRNGRFQMVRHGVK